VAVSVWSNDCLAFANLS